MTISHLSLVNQKMAYAKTIISSLNDPLPGLNPSQKLHQQSLCDAVVFHMVLALRFYVRELAEYQLIKSLSSINSINDLLDALKQADRVSSESTELDALSRTRGSWLYQLLNYYEQLSKSPEKLKEKKSFGQEGLIAVVELTEAEPAVPLELTATLLNSWFSSFRELIIRQRETSAEF